MGGPFDAEDTAQKFDARILLLEQEIHRIPLMETQIRGLDGNLSRLTTKLSENTTQTNAIKADTEWLVDVFKGFKAAGPVIGWFIMALAGLLTVIWGVITLITGHGKP